MVANVFTKMKRAGTLLKKERYGKDEKKRCGIPKSQSGVATDNDLHHLTCCVHILFEAKQALF